MAWTIPDKGEAQNDIQSICFQEYLDVLVAGLTGQDCVLNGGAVTAQGSPDMTVAVAKCGVLTNGVLKAVAGANGTITAANGTNPRIDLVVINSAGAIAVRAGTAAAAPKPPARSANDVVLAAVYVPASDTTIGSDQITDMRVLYSSARVPIALHKTTTAEVTNTTNAAIHALNKAGSGVVIPNGLFLAGRILRVRMGGNILANNSTPTIRLDVLYGGTTMFTDTSGATSLDTDRIAWYLAFDLAAQANNDQAMAGFFHSQILGAKTAPAAGIGPVFAATALGGPIGGSAAVDSDAADRTLAVTFTLSVSHASNELVVEFATVELL